MVFYKTDQYYKLYKKILREKCLTDSEKILLSLVASYDDTDNGLYMDNKAISKELNWSVKKIQRTIDGLLVKKQIIIKRNATHSPKRYIFAYKQNIIDAYKQGIFSKDYILDFYE